jgi:branched-chain amino acid transport system ATP-binding protein
VVNGSVTFQGRDVTRVRAPVLVRRGMAQALEGRRIFGGLSVLENIRVGAQGKVRADDLDRVLSLFPILAERRNQHGGLLSGGEQQMLAMARALVSNPALLVLDEPSLGLAPKIVDQVAELIVRINDEGTTVLVVEQNASVALDISDHVYIIENGRVVVSSTSAELREQEDVARYYLGATAEHQEVSYADVNRHRRGRRIV